MVKKLVELRDVVLSEQVDQYLKAKKTPSTQSTYRSGLKRFRKFLDISIIDFINKVDEQRTANKGLPPTERRRYFEETINEFITWMQEKGYANNPIRGSLTALQNLFKYYEVPISYTFVKMPPPISRKSNGKHKWTIDDIKKFVEGARNYRDKAIIMVMFQSGIAVNEISNLNYGDISKELESGEVPILIDLVRQKNSNSFKTLMGADAVKYLRLYLDTRGQIEKDDPLFAQHVGSNERISGETIQWTFRELANKVFGYKEGEMNPFRPHSLRSAFRSRLTGKTDGDLIKFWMGDNLGPKAGAYLNLPDEDHLELYLAIENRLSIESTSKEVMEGKMVSDESVRIGNLRKQINDLEKDRELDKKEIDGLCADVKDLREMVDGLLKYTDILEAQYQLHESLSGPDEAVIEKAPYMNESVLESFEESLKSDFRERKDILKELREKE